MAKTKTQKAKKAPTSKESTYLESIDLRTWWESFRFDTEKGGQQKYKTIWSFIAKQTKIKWQRDFLYWILGPKVEGDAASPYAKFEQYDWEDKLKKGIWYRTDNIQTLGQEIAKQGHAMAKLGELGKINVKFIQRLDNILQTIDQEFGGRLMLPELSMKRNKERIEMYMLLNRQVLEMMQQAQMTYGKMQGVDLQQLTQFIGMFGKGMGQVAGMGEMFGLGASVTNTEDPRRGTFDKILDMVTEKAAKHNLPLPDKDMETVLVENRKPSLVKAK